MVAHGPNIPFNMIDTHVHFWEFDPIRDAWIDNTMKAIQRDFLPEDLEPLLLENEIDGIVAVQADQSETETQFLLKLAANNPKIKGVIGWIDLLRENLSERLAKYEGEKKLKGWRHIVQAEPSGFLENPKFIDNVKIIGKAGYTYGILIFHHQFKEALDFVKKLPEQALVLNHLGKPDLIHHERTTWTKNMGELAGYKHVYCKLSGLVTEAEKGKWTEAILHTYLDVALEKFGPKRVMIGSDWPVMLLNTTYSEWMNILKEYVSKLSEQEQQDVLHNNAVNFYNLET